VKNKTMTGKPKKPNPNNRSGIGTINEFSLHAEIIQKLAREGDVLEAELEGYFIDILRGDQIIEVQTRNLGKLVKKAHALAASYKVKIVYPIAELKYIVRHSTEGELVSRRKSPKKGRVVDVFNELVNATSLISPKNVSLNILLIETDEIWKDDGQGSWRRKGWSISERRLVDILSKRQFSQPEDLLELLPDALPSPFTNAQLAQILNVRGRLAGKITYTLRKMSLLTVVGRQGRAYLFDAI
jgi:hypothetical protein